MILRRMTPNPTIRRGLAAFVALVATAFIISRPTPASSANGFELRRSSLTGSGGPSAGGTFTARTTTSQPDAGVAGAGDFQVTGGIAEGNPPDCAALAATSGVFTSPGICAAVRVIWLDDSSLETGYRIRRDGVELALAAPNVTTYDDSTAVPGVTYSYTVATAGACGEANASNAAPGRRPLAPVAPSGVQITGVTYYTDSTVVNLSWNDNSADEVSQIVYRMDSTPTVLQAVPPNAEATQFTIPYEGASLHCFAVAATNCNLEAMSDATCVTTVGVPGEGEPGGIPLPTAYALGPLGPNPFVSRMTIAFDVPRAAPMSIRVYDVGGRLFRTLREGVVSPGRYAIQWDGRGEKSPSRVSGIYFLEMRAPGYRKVSRITLLR